ncbi:MAG: hypothetical protein JKY65_04190 [Planctomycetes bacterium]|nr:hypothetical protein [Planctomycetota bacterium]
MPDDSGHLRAILSQTAAIFQTAVTGRPEAGVAPADLEGLSLEEASAELPDPIRRAFSLEDLSDSARKLASCDETWSEIDDLVRRFLRGRRAAIAVTGLRGTGRRGYLQRIASIAGEGEDVGLSRLRFDSIRTGASEFLGPAAQALGLEAGDLDPDDLARQLLEGPRRVVIVERAHNLYMRKIGGFEALQAALALVAATLDTVLWVFEIDRYAWEYLDELSQLHDYFDLIVEAPLLSEEDLKEVFERQLSDLDETFPTKFLAPKDLPESQRETWREEGFYKRLHAASSGNLESAGILFCRSTRWSVQLKKAVVLPIPTIPFEEALSSYPRTSLLALAMLVEHEELSQQDLADLLLISPGRAQSVLDTFVRHSVTTRRETGRYVVNTPWLAAIGSHLSNWNVL